MVSLAGEIESASALCRVGIVLTVDADGPADDVPEREVGATVRGTVTNMLKHARA